MVLLQWVHHLLVLPKPASGQNRNQTNGLIYRGFHFLTNRDAEHLNKQICMNSLVSRLRQTPADRGNPKIRTTFQTHDQDFHYSDQMLTVPDLKLLCKT